MCGRYDTLSGGRGNGTLRLRNERIYFLFIFFFVTYILFASHTMYAPRVQRSVVWSMRGKTHMIPTEVQPTDA